jgi:hypothetical protein
MDFLKFVVTAVLSSALVSAALLAIISYLSPRVGEASTVSRSKSSSRYKT